MATSKRTRGRPKGTGINDEARLIEIARLRAANPSLKPTTAIKQAGVTNPSVVRRLRDKFAAAESRLMAMVKTAPVTTTATAKSKARASGRKTGMATIATATLAAAPIVVPVTAKAMAGRKAKAAPVAAPAPSINDDMIAIATAAARSAVSSGNTSIESIVTRVVGEVLGMKPEEMSASPIAALIREQARMVDLILPLLKGQIGSQLAALKIA